MKPLSLLLLYPGAALAQGTVIEREYRILYGTQPNIESANESVLGLSSLVFDQLNLAIEENVPTGGLRFASRLTNFTVVQIYAGGLFFGTFLHEQFGHKSRASEFGLPLELQLDFPGLGGDFVFPVDNAAPALERQMVVSSGPEATSLIAYDAIKGLYGDDHTGSYVGLYLLSGKLIEGILTVQSDINPFLADPNAYYANNRRLGRNPTPNDPLAYLLALTESYGYHDNILDRDSLLVQRQAGYDRLYAECFHW